MILIVLTGVLLLLLFPLLGISPTGIDSFLNAIKYQFFSGGSVQVKPNFIIDVWLFCNLQKQQFHICQIL